MRKSYLDNLRSSVVLIVVLYHVLYMYNAEGILGGLGKITSLEVQYYDVFMYAVYPWMMPVLFLAAGMASRFYLEQHTDRAFLKSRTRKLLVPSTIGLFAFQFLQGMISVSLGGGEGVAELPLFMRYLIYAVSGTGVLWFAQLLWVFSVLLIGLRRVHLDSLREKCAAVSLPVLLLLTAAVFLSAQAGNLPVIVVYRFGFYGLFYLLGYCVFSHDAVIDRWRERFPLFAGLAVITGIAFCVRYFPENFAEAPINRSPLFTSFAWFGSLALLGGYAKYGDQETKRTLWLRGHSFGLYVFHYLGISATALFLAKPRILSALVIYPLSLFMGLASGVGLYELISRIPLLRWAVLGMKKEKSDVSR